MSPASTTADLEETTVPSDPTRPLPRRTMFAVSGTAVLAAAAACSSGTAATGTTAAPSSAPGSPSASSVPAGAASAASASTPPAPPTADATTPAPPSAAAGPAEPAPSGTPVASVAEVQAAGSLVVGENEDAYLLAYAGDTVVAHTAVCTHQRCTVGASGLCPCHQSRFDVATGAVINGPALRPLAERGVTVSGGQVYLT
ncbi:Rieske (2Fe-2S) protein [Nakamurella sp.]|uniref:Rieske (2Fe-2S) protein n=1 Tax=Nakamurella sp. TaxID=1869182 RepID=UPI003784C4C5